MNVKYVYAFAGLLLGLTACSNEDLMPTSGQQKGETVFISLKVDRNKAETRTIIEETDVTDGVGLSNVWAAGDQVTLVAADGAVAGTLTLQGEGGESESVFSGELTITDGEYGVWYLGDARNGDSYAKFENGQLVNALATAGCSVSGDFADLNKGDLMKNKVQIKVSDGKATVSNDVKLEAQMAMAHFTLSGDGIADALTAEGATLTFAYGDYSYSIGNVNADVYVPMIPGTYNPYYTFTLASGGKTYTYSQANDNNNPIVAGVYYCGPKDAEGNSTGIGVTLTEDTSSSVGDEDLVGPVFDVNGKKFRFTRANLHYNVTNDEWYLPEQQTEFAHQSGRRILSEESTPSYEKIDLFRWGTTGIDNARPADFWKETKDDSSALKISNKLPSSDSDFNSKLHEDVESVKGTAYDWGKAYSSSGKYYTLTEAELRSVIDNNCVVLATVDGKNGALLTDSKNFEELKTKKKLSNLPKLSLSVSSNSNVKWDMVSLTYDELSEYNAVFFPAVGYHEGTRTFDYSDLGWYWTSTIKTSSNAVAWNFNGAANAFNLEGKYKGYAMAVRLVKEVTTK